MLDFDIPFVLTYTKNSLILTDEEYAEELGINRTTLYNWIQGISKPSAGNTALIFDYAYSHGLRMNRAMEQIYKEKYSSKGDHILFHGARHKITEAYCLEKCESENDFGKAMYFGESFDQSAAFVHANKEGCVYVNYFQDTSFIGLEYKVDQDWMLTIAWFRNYIPEYGESPVIRGLIDRLSDVDYIIAPIADNNMFAVIEDFVAGNITDIQCHHALSASNLGRQYVFRTQKVLESIVPLRLCYLSSGERRFYREMGHERKKESDDKVRLARQEFSGQGKYINQILG